MPGYNGENTYDSNKQNPTASKILKSYSTLYYKAKQLPMAEFSGTNKILAPPNKILSRFGPSMTRSWHIPILGHHD